LHSRAGPVGFENGGAEGGVMGAVAFVRRTLLFLLIWLTGLTWAVASACGPVPGLSPDFDSCFGSQIPGTRRPAGRP
jgi:hypothetical protein